MSRVYTTYEVSDSVEDDEVRFTHKVKITLRASEE